MGAFVSFWGVRCVCPQGWHNESSTKAPNKAVVIFLGSSDKERIVENSCITQYNHRACAFVTATATATATCCCYYGRYHLSRGCARRLINNHCPRITRIAKNTTRRVKNLPLTTFPQVFHRERTNLSAQSFGFFFFFHPRPHHRFHKK